jgi:hypothetical protein
MSDLVLVGAGASVREGIEQGLWWNLRRQNVWSLNYAFKVMPFIPSAQVWRDLGVWAENQNELLRLYNRGCCLYTKKLNDYATRPEIRTYGEDREVFHGREGVRKDKIFIGRMGLTGVFALSLAIAKGYDRVFLLGYDFGSSSFTDKDTHFYEGLNSEEGQPNIYLTSDGLPRSEVEDFDRFLVDGVEIFNVSPRSHIGSFPKIEYSEFFRRISHGKCSA